MLQLDENAVQTFNGFASLHSLTTLSLSRNDIREQEDATIGGILPAGLTSLDLSYNCHLSAVPPCLEALSSLRKLSLEGCPIDSIDLGHGVHATSGIVEWGKHAVDPHVHQAYRWHVARCVPQVRTLDGLAVTPDERAHAAARWSGVR